MRCFYFFFLLLLCVLYPLPVLAAPLTHPWPIEIINVDSGRDRCRVSDCTCRISPGPRPTNPVHFVEMERRHEVYFSEDSYELQSTYQLEHFLQSFISTSGVEISLVGYTDGCGSTQYNRGLSASRAYAVEQAISEILPRAKVSRIAAGEKSDSHYPEARKVDIIVHSTSRITTLIEKVPADVYLIDASGSMWNAWKPWTDVINASYRKDSRIYVSITSGCRTNQIINDIAPHGSTEIWYSYWWILTNVIRQGETLAIISDFESNIRLTATERRTIEGLVRQKQVRVIAITP